MLKFRYNDYRFALEDENILKIVQIRENRAEINTGRETVSRKKKPYDRQVFRAVTLIMQFGLNMLVPICLMSAAGIWLDKHFGTNFWMILLFCMGAVAGGQNVYRMARTIYEDSDDKHIKKDK